MRKGITFAKGLFTTLDEVSTLEKIIEETNKIIIKYSTRNGIENPSEEIKEVLIFRDGLTNRLGVVIFPVSNDKDIYVKDLKSGKGV